MKRLLSRNEESALAELNAVTAPYGLCVHAKVRIADVCPIDGSGISDELYKYSLMAHFDFLITGEDYMPRFAVEFDDPSHGSAIAKARDAKKDALCHIFSFPLLRIKFNYIPKKYNSLSLLEWIIDVYHLQQAFNDAQGKGHISEDEPFDPFFIISTSADGDSRRFPYWISRRANLAIRKHHKQGKIARPGTSGFIGEDSDGNMQGIEYLKVTDIHGVFVTSGMRSQLFPVSFADLLRELLLIFVHEKLEEVLLSGTGLTPLNTIYRLMDRYRSRLKILTAHSTG